MSYAAAELFSLAGKTVLLTGASGFLGRTFAAVLLANGARLIALGRSERLAAEGARWKAQYGNAKVRTERVDMNDIGALVALLERLAAEEPKIDVLVNNAHELGPQTGFNIPEGSLEHATPEQLERNLAGGVLWPALATQKVGALMKQHGGGAIVNVASMYAVVAPSPQLYEGTRFLNPPGYSTAKAALVGLTRYTASMWGGHGIRANALLPGPFSNVEDVQSANAVSAEDPFLARLRQRTCLGRVGRPQELAGALLYLCSDASSYMTGHCFVVDGGWTVT